MAHKGVDRHANGLDSNESNAMSRSCGCLCFSTRLRIRDVSQRFTRPTLFNRSLDTGTLPHYFIVAPFFFLFLIPQLSSCYLRSRYHQLDLELGVLTFGILIVSNLRPKPLILVVLNLHKFAIGLLISANLTSHTPTFLSLTLEEISSSGLVAI